MAEAFNAEVNSTVGISVSSSSQAVRVRGSDESGAYQVLVTNLGTATAWIAWGGSAITTSIPSGSTAGGIGIGAGVVQVFTVTGQYMAAIAAGATGTIEFTPGAGI